MATKYITRTINEYTYTTGKLNLSTMKIENMQQHTYGYKLGSREEKQLEKRAGAPIIARDTAEKLYGMSVEDFMFYAQPFGPDGKPYGLSRAQIAHLDPEKDKAE